MLCGSRKKSTARFPPCWKRPRRSPAPLSTCRDGRATSECAPRLLLYRERGLSMGCLGDARPRRFHRAPAAGRSFARKHRSAHPLPEPRYSVAGGALAGAAAAERSVGTTRSRTRSAAVLSAGSFRSRCLELSLLPCHPTNKRSHSHHSAIHGAGLGVALHRGARSATAIPAEKRGGGVGRAR